MKLIHQAVVKGFMLRVPDHLHPNKTQLRQGAVDGGLVHTNFGSGSTDIFWGKTARRIIDKAFSMKREEKFPTGHVLESAAGLNPVPIFTQFPGNMGPAPVPVFTDHCLDDGQVLSGNFAVSDG